MQEGELARLQRALSCMPSEQQQAMKQGPRRVTPGTPAPRPRTAPAAAKRGAGAAASFCLLPGLLPTAGAPHLCRSGSWVGQNCSV